MSYRVSSLALPVAAVAAAWAFAGQAALAAPVPFASPSGSTALITYSDGQTDAGLYGNPTVSGSSFVFGQPGNFFAAAANGTAQTTADRVSFKVSANNGQDLRSVTVSEFGDWSILGPVANVKVAGLAFVTDLGPSHLGTVNATPTVSYLDTEHNLTYAGVAHPTTDGSGSFARLLTFTLPGGYKSVQFVMDNILQATSVSGTTGFIQKKGVTITFNNVVPEPASLGLLAVGGAMALRRGRRVV